MSVCLKHYNSCTRCIVITQNTTGNVHCGD
jgi:hypothetical protein